MSDKKRGMFLTCEGVDGSGKTTNVQWLAEYLRAGGKEVYVTREPGGTPLGEKLREILFTNEMDPETEALLMFASRRDHVERVIKPLLEKGIWVISDRFTDSSFGLQGFGGGANILGLNDLEKFVHPNFEPDLTILFDLPVEVARERNAGTAKKDRFELMDLEYHKRVRQGFLYRKDQSGDRVQLINADQTVEMIRHDIVNIMDNFDERLNGDHHGYQQLLALVADPEYNER
ncbi:MAG: hypothetical protein ACD_84C00039G0007 [uncultured bacterium]|nr:MAG: hypothetical protein ACD_84C00039G0007 [uncultured bacterium]